MQKNKNKTKLCKYKSTEKQN